MQLEDWLDDLCVRFIINLPPEELQSVERICFQVEEAQWFYEDFIRPLDPSLPSLSLRAFSLRIFQHCPLFSQWSAQHHTTAFAEFLAYKSRVPVRGAIMLNEAMDEVVLVKGWKKSANWSFPRGKINKDENDLDCAVREVYEETGFDIRAAGLVKDEKDMKYIEVTMREQHMRLYVFRGVPKDTHFEPKTRKEISKIEWYKLTDLPTLKKNRQQDGSGTDQPALNANKFYMVAPFLTPLKKWIAQQRKKENRYSSQLAAPPMVPEEATTEDERDNHAVGAETGQHRQQGSSDLPEVSALPVSDPTSHLKEMLNIGSVPLSKPLQPLQLPPPPPPSQPAHMPQVDEEKSHALLALLRNGQQGPPGPQPIPPPHTPFEQISALPEEQRSPHPSHVRPPQLDRLPPPPQFFGQPEGLVQPSPLSFNGHNAGSRTTQGTELGSIPMAPRIAPYQQTLEPPYAQERPMELAQRNVPPASALPQLTNHTKALLDVFKAAPSPPAIPTLDQVQPQLAPEPAPVGSMQPGGEKTQAQFQGMPSVQRPVDAHKTSLLGLFHQPSRPKTDNAHGPHQAPPVELAATNPASTSQHQAPSKNGLLGLLKEGGRDWPRQEPEPKYPSPREGETAATVRGPLNQPDFEVVSRTTRQMTSEMRRSPVPTNRTLYDPKQPTPVKILTRSEGSRAQAPRSPQGLKGPPKRAAREKAVPKAPTKPFQPQILRRPQRDDKPGPASLATAITDSPKTEQVITTKTARSPSLTPSGSEMLTPRRQLSQTEDQKQRLLSLFGGVSDTTPKAVTTGQSGSGLVSPLSTSHLYSADYEMPLSGLEPISTRTSRVGSLASIGSGPGVGRAGGEKRQTGAENKAFLLGYLGRIANQEK
ncbi:mRNA decapping complex subunit 2 [Exophiala dermatitidis]